MATWLDEAIRIMFLGAGLVTLFVIFAVARQMSTGIFRRFFLLLRLTLIIVVINRVDVLLPAYGLTSLMGSETADYIYRTLWTLLLMASFIFLYVDWRNTSLDQPIKPRLKVTER